MSLTNCRFYEEKYPEVDSYVMVNVKQVCLFPAIKMDIIGSSGTDNLGSFVVDCRDGRIREAARIR